METRPINTDDSTDGRGELPHGKSYFVEIVASRNNLITFTRSRHHREVRGFAKNDQAHVEQKI